MEWTAVTQDKDSWRHLVSAGMNVRHPINAGNFIDTWRTLSFSRRTLLRNYLGGVADKSLAQPGRKQATATKLGIYSTYSPRSSIHFLARCSNFCKPLKKIQKFVRPTRSPRQHWPPRRKKNGDISIVFSVQGTGGRPTGPDPENRVGDQDIEAQVGQFLLGCMCPVSWDIFVQEQDPLGELPEAFFLQNVLQSNQQRLVILRVDGLVL